MGWQWRRSIIIMWICNDCGRPTVSFFTPPPYVRAYPCVCVCIVSLYYLLEYFMSWRVFLRLPRQPRRESKRATQTAGEKEKEPSSDRQGSLTNKSVCRHATMRMQESPSICLRTLIIRSSACYSVVPKHWFRVMMTEPPWTRAKWLWTAQYSAKRS